jgi:hypothetical protein
VERDLKRLLWGLRAAFRSVGWDKASGRLGITLLIVSAVFFAANFADKAWVSYQAGQEEQQRVAAVNQLNSQIQALQQELTYAHSRSFYMQEARKYGYVQPGDVQLQISSTVAPSNDTVQVDLPPAVKHKTQNNSLLHRLLQAVVPGL